MTRDTMSRSRMLCATLFLGLWTSAAGAQTRFQLPDTTADVARYKSVEECIVAATRVSQAAMRQMPGWRDTMALVQSEFLDATPPGAVATARTCSAKFRPDSVAVTSYRNWLKLYLLANRDDDAEMILRRRLASSPWNIQDSVNGRHVILSNAMAEYLAARPVRWETIKSIGAMFEAPDASVNARVLLSTYGVQFDVATAVSDTVMRQRMAQKIAALDTTLTHVKAETWYRVYGRYVVTAALDFLSHEALLDSLRRNAGAYVALKRANWEKARGNSNSDALPLFIGQTAPPLAADFWFPAGSAGRPTPGKVSLIVFLRPGCREDAFPSQGQLLRQLYGAKCWETYAAMRRLVRQFPTVELTVASQTTGYLGETPPLSPSDEAKVMRSWWLDFHHLPATLAVVNTQFFRLQEPDRRRIDRPVPNNVNYMFGSTKVLGTKMAYLIDVNGMILHSGDLGRQGEPDFRDILEVVTRRSQ